MRQIRPTELKAWLDDPQRVAPLLLDVRELWEFERCPVPSARLVPMGSVPAHLAELDPTRETVVICHHGVRSAQVTMWLRQQGWRNVYNMAGGIAAWALEIDPSVGHY